MRGTNCPKRRARFLAMVGPPTATGCRHWLGSRNNCGYGTFHWGPECGKVLAHRAAYTLFVGPIPIGKQAMHRCDDPPCVEPSHLRVGTMAENMQQMVERGRAARQRGRANGNAVLTASQVRAIRRRLETGETTREIGAAFGVSSKHVSRIGRMETWTHV